MWRSSLISSLATFAATAHAARQSLTVDANDRRISYAGVWDANERGKHVAALEGNEAGGSDRQYQYTRPTQRMQLCTLSMAVQTCAPAGSCSRRQSLESTARLQFPSGHTTSGSPRHPLCSRYLTLRSRRRRSAGHLHTHTVTLRPSWTTSAIMLASSS
ncbi:hypothetical protein C8Q70DRAFT_264807 [Cubamyces menziesii]|nr:hypothetical protein C8Q70DRAFT_264807 [Cubamyces menziesii]